MPDSNQNPDQKVKFRQRPDGVEKLRQASEERQKKRWGGDVLPERNGTKNAPKTPLRTKPGTKQVRIQQ